MSADFGADLVTFYNPAFWGVPDSQGIATLAGQDPRHFWTRILDTLHKAGIRGIELTFPPFNWSGLIEAFGTTQDVRDELGRRGLEIWSAFFADIEAAPPVAERGTQWDNMIRSATDAARFLSQTGGRILVAGLPLRQTFLHKPLCFVDLHAALPVADLLNHIGAATAEHGIALALHTEAHTMFCQSRDIALFMLLTDPRYVGLCPDSAHITLEGSDPIEVLRAHRDRIVTAHWKDALGPMPRETPIDAHIHERHRDYFCEMGHGVVDFAQWADVLERAPLLSGPILELDACKDPAAALVHARKTCARMLARQ
ncbi:sugar phosphate isomerase/epimerase [Komagataeibacter sp. FXV3]|uniref:sugar phosphate isomerase/epimerase family protein n=1 Tax=Komagataeibacter sp. FXV3 TaxID=2608998 RepID=UPI00187B56A2|nr:sugar phosphate isomerase/epimerase [Komagataeibacter sp. FXV3]MBE7728302.1 sugar phosphate isomerase/epimerase [Komagataeibacter sp. FXV3]